jgi:hypothetical protein
MATFINFYSCIQLFGVLSTTSKRACVSAGVGFATLSNFADVRTTGLEATLIPCF